MDELTLRSTLKALETSRSLLDTWLNFWTSLVVIGVIVEVFVVVKEYLDDLRDFWQGTIHAPEKPHAFLFLLGLFGATSVALGVTGELKTQAKLGIIETEIEDTADQLVALVSREAGNAKTSADNAEDAAGRAKYSADQANKEAVNAKLASDKLREDSAKAERQLTDDLKAETERSEGLTRYARGRHIRDVAGFKDATMTLYEHGDLEAIIISIDEPEPKLLVEEIKASLASDWHVTNQPLSKRPPALGPLGDGVWVGRIPGGPKRKNDDVPVQGKRPKFTVLTSVMGM